MKKRKILEGTIFAIPLRDVSGFGVGVIAKIKGNGALGYFYNVKIASDIEILDDSLVTDSNIILKKNIWNQGVR